MPTSREVAAGRAMPAQLNQECGIVYCAEHGAELHRPGQVQLECSRAQAGGDWRIRVGGHAITVVEGTIVA